MDMWLCVCNIYEYMLVCTRILYYIITNLYTIIIIIENVRWNGIFGCLFVYYIAATAVALRMLFFGRFCLCFFCCCFCQRFWTKIKRNQVNFWLFAKKKNCVVAYDLPNCCQENFLYNTMQYNTSDGAQTQTMYTQTHAHPLNDIEQKYIIQTRAYIEKEAIRHYEITHCII